MTSLRTIVASLAVAALTLFAAHGARALPTYDLFYIDTTPLPVNPPAPTTRPDREVVGLAINNAAQTTGCVEANAASLCDPNVPVGDATAYRSNLGAVTPLSPFGPGTRSRGLDINDAGKITGWSFIDSSDTTYRAFRDNGGTTDIIAPLAGDANSLGNAINAAGQVTGYSANVDTSALHAFRYTSGAPEDLGAYGGLGGSQSEGKAINGAGTVTGWATIDAGDTTAHAFRQSGTAPMQDLGTVAGKSNSFGVAINASGSVAGCATNNPNGCTFNDSRAFIATGPSGTAVDLLAVTPAGIPTSANSGANAINTGGIVVGWVENGVTYANPNPGNQGVTDPTLTQTRAYWYDGAMHLIPLLPPTPDLGGIAGLLFHQVAEAINDSDLVVGYQEMWVDNAGTEVLRRHGFIYDILTGELVDIDAQILSLVPGLDPNWDNLWRFTNGFAISDSGAILADCRFVSDATAPDGTELRACVLVPADEPGSFAIFAAALAALAAFAACRRLARA